MTTDTVRAMRVGLQALPHLDKVYKILDSYQCLPGQECNQSCPMFPKDKPGLDGCIVLITRRMIEHIKELEFDVKQKRLIDCDLM